MELPARSLDGMTLAEAQAAFLAVVAPVAAITLPLADVGGLALAEPITAPFPLPAFDNAAMDGFAVRAADVTGATAARPVALVLRGEAAAGHALVRGVGAGEAARIMTGAPLPAGADAVVPLEEAAEVGGCVELRAAVPAGRHVRRAGEDIPDGATVLAAGSALDAPQLAVLAALGCAEVLVVRRPRVAVLTTGDELRLPGEPRGAAGVYNANLFALAAQVREAGADAILLPACADTPEAIGQALERALGMADAVITSAGMCAGHHDHVAATVNRLGRLAVGCLRVRPARHAGLGLIGRVPVFALPGNPGASLIACELLARPALRRMGGHALWQRPQVPATVAGTFPGASDVAAVHWARLEPDGAGWRAQLAGQQGAGMLHAAMRAHGLVIVPEGAEGYVSGATVRVQLLSGLAPSYGVMDKRPQGGNCP